METAKYCSVNCRVKWNQKNGKKSKAEIKPFQMQALYNAVFEMVVSGKGEMPFKGVMNIGELKDGKVVNVRQITRSPEQWHELKRACESTEEWLKLKEQIETAENLSTKQKQTIINTP